MGPYRIQVSAVDQAAGELTHAIYLAAHEVDKKNNAQLHATVAHALAGAGIPCAPDEAVQVSAGGDGRVWLSFVLGAVPGEPERHELAARVVVALADAALRLTASMPLTSDDLAKRLINGEPLQVEPGAAA